MSAFRMPRSLPGRTRTRCRDALATDMCIVSPLIIPNERQLAPHVLQMRRFQQISRRTHRERIHCVLLVTGHEHDMRIRIDVLERLRQRQATQPRHFDIQKRYVDTMLSRIG